MTTEADYPPLRHCPFCGKVPQHVDYHVFLEQWVIPCGDPCGNWIVSATSKAEAADKWNRRAKL